MKHRHVGSTVESLLAEDALAEEVYSTAIKHVIAWQIEEAMKAKGTTKSEMARRMRTSRSQLDRLLDPENDKVMLETIGKAAAAIGKRLRIVLEDAA